jgi:hypothetical protein
MRYTRLDDLMKALTPRAPEIDQQAKEGNAKAQEVIRYYRMAHACPDPGAQMFLAQAFEEWEEANPKEATPCQP